MFETSPAPAPSRWLLFLFVVLVEDQMEMMHQVVVLSWRMSWLMMVMFDGWSAVTA